MLITCCCFKWDRFCLLKFLRCQGGGRIGISFYFFLVQELVSTSAVGRDPIREKGRQYYSIPKKSTELVEETINLGFTFLPFFPPFFLLWTCNGGVFLDFFFADSWGRVLLRRRQREGTGKVVTHLPREGINSFLLKSKAIPCKVPLKALHCWGVADDCLNFPWAIMPAVTQERGGGKGQAWEGGAEYSKVVSPLLKV